MDLLPLLFVKDVLTGQAAIYAGIALAFGIGFTAVFYLLSYVLNHPPLNALAKEELAALILSIFIIGGWLFFQSALWQITCSVAFGACNMVSGTSGPPTHITVAYYALEIIFLKLKSIYMGLYLYEVLVGFLSTVYVPLGTFNPLIALLPVSFPPLVGLTLLSNAHTVLVEAIGMTMVAVIAKQHLLNFANYGIPTVFLPLGLVLRAFPFFRTTGSSIIAICIAAYFIYPLSVMLSNYMIIDLYKPVDMVYAPTAVGFCEATSKGTSQTDALAEKAKEIKEFREHWQTFIPNATEEKPTGFFSKMFDGIGGFFKGLWSTVTTLWEILKFTFKVFGDFAFSLIGISWGASGYGIPAGLFNFVMDEVVTVSQFVVTVIITSVFEIIITVTMYRNISLMIGGEMDIAGLSKLV